MYTATCLCGACHIQIGSIKGTGICHCITCRKMSSSMYTVNALVPKTDFRLVSGTPKTRQLTGDSDINTIMNFCGECGSVLWMDYSPLPEWKILKAGILDGDEVFETKELRPIVEQYTVRRPSWVCPVSRADQEEQMQKPRKPESI